MNLVSCIKGVENEIYALKCEYENKLKELQEGLNIVRKLNTVCEKCNGIKQVTRPRSCAEDDSDREMIPCPECKGTGKAKKVEDVQNE